MPVTAAAYGQALVGETPTPWGAVPGLGADAFTANPLLGRRRPRAAGRGRGGGRRRDLRAGPHQQPRRRRPPGPAGAGRARCTSAWRRWSTSFADRLAGAASPGLSGMGAVVGATEPEHIARLRELMPRAIFLIPGVGAQGGRPEQLGAAFAAGPASALVPASRSIAGDPDPAAAAERLRAAVWDVSTA